MIEKYKHIDEYFKKHLKELESETSYNRWKTLYWKLFWKKRAFWIITTIGTALLISGLLLIYNSQEPLEFYSKSEKKIDSISSKQLTTGFDSASSETSKILQNHQEINTTSTESNKEIQNEDSISDAVSPEIASNSSGKVFTREAIEPVYPKIKEHPTVGQIHKIPIILFEDIELFTNDLPEINKIELTSNSIKDSANNISTKNLINKDFSIGIYILPAYVTKSLKAEETYGNYLNLRSDSEDNIFVMELGAEFRLSLNKMYLQSGLEYSVYGENVKYNFTTSTVDLQNSNYSYDTTWVWIYDPPFYGEPHPIAIDSTWNAAYEKIEMTSSGRTDFNL